MDESSCSVILLILAIIPIGLTVYFVRDWIKSEQKRIPDTLITFWIVVYGIVGALPLIVQPILFASLLGTVCYALGAIACTIVFIAMIISEYREGYRKNYSHFDDVLEDIITNSFLFGAPGMALLIISVIMNTAIWIPL